MSFTKERSLSEACFEDVVMAALDASPLYTVRDASHFDAATLLDAEQLWGFISEATQPKELVKLQAVSRCPARSAGGPCNRLDSQTRHAGSIEKWRVVQRH